MGNSERIRFKYTWTCLPPTYTFRLSIAVPSKEELRTLFKRRIPWVSLRNNNVCNCLQSCKQHVKINENCLLVDYLHKIFLARYLNTVHYLYSVNIYMIVLITSPLNHTLNSSYWDFILKKKYLKTINILQLTNPIIFQIIILFLYNLILIIPLSTISSILKPSLPLIGFLLHLQSFTLSFQTHIWGAVIGPHVWCHILPLSLHILFSFTHHPQTVNRNISQIIFPSFLLSASALFPWEDRLTSDFPPAPLARIPYSTCTHCRHLTRSLSFLPLNQVLLLTSFTGLTLFHCAQGLIPKYIVCVCVASLLTIVNNFDPEIYFTSHSPGSGLALSPFHTLRLFPQAPSL